MSGILYARGSLAFSSRVRGYIEPPTLLPSTTLLLSKIKKHISSTKYSSVLSGLVLDFFFPILHQGVDYGCPTTKTNAFLFFFYVHPLYLRLSTQFPFISTLQTEAGAQDLIK